MKKVISLIFSLLLIVLSAASCGRESEPRNASTLKSVDDVLSTADGQTSAGKPASTYKKGEFAPEDIENVDIDLTALSSTMVDSEVNNMLTEPDSYQGKKILMKGAFAVYEGESRNYYACIIADATACCSQGIEFIPVGNRTYPQDFPELGDEISVVGIFDTYYEGSQRYCQLIDAKMA